MRYGSLFSGVEAATLAFAPLGWRPAWFAEDDPFCGRVLAERWPAVRNLGDVDAADFVRRTTPVDLIVGGPPCKDFSTSGKRRGLDGPQGRLTRRFVELVGGIRPQWLIFENVVGLLQSNGGRDWGEVQGNLEECGYDLWQRTLNLRDFGIPQDRERVYLVGRLGDERAEPLRLDAPAGQEAPAGRRARPAVPQPGGRHRLVACRSVAMRGGGGSETVVVVRRDEPDHVFACLRTGANNWIWDGARIRRLTPVECERLMGMPDRHTLVDGATDAERVTACANSMGVPVMRWLAERIAATSSP